MADRLPPLNALRAFATAAQHLSIAKAAQQLNVTPAAVSQQIRLLETHLGVPLFRRLNRAVALTEAGQACLPGLLDGFARLADAVARVASVTEAGVLTVSVAPSFAAKWLVPRLDSFREAAPGIDVRISASMQLTDFARDAVDLAIRYGGGNYPGASVERLLPEMVFPVCSPVLMQGAHPLTAPDRLAAHTLLHDDNPEQDETCPDWRMWLRAAGVEGVDPARGPRFNQSSLVLEAAINGRGVALAKSQLAAADMRAGRLVKPFELSFPVAFAYYVVCPPATAELPKVRRFRAWLKAEAERHLAEAA